MNQVKKTVMGVDLGTQSIKVIIYCPDDRETLSIASQPLDMISKEDGSREQQAIWWIEGFKKCIGAIDPELKKIALSTFALSVLFWLTLVFQS